MVVIAKTEMTNNKSTRLMILNEYQESIRKSTPLSVAWQCVFIQRFNINDMNPNLIFSSSRLILPMDFGDHDRHRIVITF